MDQYKYYVKNDQYLLNYDIDKPDMILIFDLGQYYEEFRCGRNSTGVFPINKGGIVTTGGKTFFVDRVECSSKGKSIAENGYDFDGHCYIFIDITEKEKAHIKPFAKKASEVNKSIMNKTIVVQDFGFN